MIASFVIGLREGIEAALVVGIVLGYLKKIGAESLERPVYGGIILGVAASIGVAGTFVLLAVGFKGSLETTFEGATMFISAAILTSVIVWMRKNSMAMSEDLKARLASAATQGTTLGLASLAFFSIFREGVETVLFLGSTSFTSSGAQVLIGGSLGLAVAFVIGVLIIRYSVRLDLRTFFSVTGVLLILFAAGLVARGVVEFQEAGYFPSLVEHVWDTGGLVAGDSYLGNILTALLGYDPAPSLMEILWYAAYWLLLVAWLYRDAALGLVRRLTGKTHS